MIENSFGDLSLESRQRDDKFAANNKQLNGHYNGSPAGRKKAGEDDRSKVRRDVMTSKQSDGVKAADRSQSNHQNKMESSPVKSEQIMNGSPEQLYTTTTTGPSTMLGVYQMVPSNGNGTRQNPNGYHHSQQQQQPHLHQNLASTTTTTTIADSFHPHPHHLPTHHPLAAPAAVAYATGTYVPQTNSQPQMTQVVAGINDSSPPIGGQQNSRVNATVTNGQREAAVEEDVVLNGKHQHAAAIVASQQQAMMIQQQHQQQQMMHQHMLAAAAAGAPLGPGGPMMAPGMPPPNGDPAAHPQYMTSNAAAAYYYFYDMPYYYGIIT